MSWQQEVELYEKGVITQTELVDQLIKSPPAEFLAHASEEYKKLVADRIDMLPKTDEDWARMRCFGFNMSQEQGRQEIELLRDGVTRFRNHMTPCVVYQPTEAQKAWVCLCYLCHPRATEFCELVPDLWLFEEDGKWGLMAQPGHGKDYVVLWFPEKPWVDPDPDCEHDGDDIADASTRWTDMVCEWEEGVTMPPQDGHFLVQSCKEAGWGAEGQSHPLLLQWLFNHAGVKLAELQSGHGTTDAVRTADEAGADSGLREAAGTPPPGA